MTEGLIAQLVAAFGTSLWYWFLYETAVLIRNCLTFFAIVVPIILFFRYAIVSWTNKEHKGD